MWPSKPWSQLGRVPILATLVTYTTFGWVSDNMLAFAMQSQTRVKANSFMFLLSLNLQESPQPDLPHGSISGLTAGDAISVLIHVVSAYPVRWICIVGSAGKPNNFSVIHPAFASPITKPDEAYQNPCRHVYCLFMFVLPFMFVPISYLPSKPATIR
jgi:hypothetical protein